MKIAGVLPDLKTCRIVFYCFSCAPPHDVLGVESQFWYLPEQPARLLACVPACLLACFNCLLVFRVLACLLACVLPCLLACLLAFLVCFFACLLALLVCLLACCLLACLLACLPGRLLAFLGQGQWGTKTTPLHTHKQVHHD